METIVLYPSPGMGHLISMVELGKFILRHHPSLSITILTLPPSFNSGTAPHYLRHISATVPSITFHHLPSVPIDPHTFPSMEAVIHEILHRSHPHIGPALQTISTSAAVAAFIVDFFCAPAIPAAAELRIPAYCFVTSGAHFTSLLLYFPELDRTTAASFKDMKATPVHIPGVPPVPASDMPKPLLYRTSTDYQKGLIVSGNVLNTAGVIINTFESLESAPLKAIREGKCNPGGRTPPVFCVGPLLMARDGDGGGGGGGHGCLKWLDGQPPKSVVYLCFGSLGLLSAAQLREIGEGLERSRRRFLWVVRSPPEEASKWFVPPAEPDLEALLPAGFVERTAERGLVVKSWAPQVAVLNHEAVGGFVTHCGWNSLLEAVCAAVPMAAWPLYAEQHFNRVVLVEEKLALNVEAAEDGFVAAEEVERRVAELMDGESEKGREIRKVVEKKSEEAKAAMAEGGSSVAELANIVNLWKSNY